MPFSTIAALRHRILFFNEQILFDLIAVTAGTVLVKGGKKHDLRSADLFILFYLLLIAILGLIHPTNWQTVRNITGSVTILYALARTSFCKDAARIFFSSLSVIFLFVLLMNKITGQGFMLYNPSLLAHLFVLLNLHAVLDLTRAIRNCKKKNLLSIISALCGMTAIILLGSRTSFLCIVTVISFALLWTSRKRALVAGSQKYLIACLLLGVVFTALLVLKWDSTSGRFFVLQRTICLFISSLPTGIGPGNFASVYMHEQAHYFAHHSLFSSEAFYADDLYVANNTFIEFLCETGILGLLFLVLVFGGCVFAVARFRREEKFLVPLAFSLVLFIFCSLSYPFYNTSLKIYLLYFFADAMRIIPFRSLVAVTSVLRMVGVISLTSVGAVFAAMDLHTEYYLSKARKCEQEVGRRRNYEEATRFDLTHLAELEFGVYLKTRKCFALSLPLLRKASRQFPSSGLYVMIGECYDQMKMYGLAEEAYWCSIRMVPNRFVPKFRLFRLYIATGNSAKAGTVAAMIRDQKIKIPSAIIEEMKHMAEEYLQGVAVSSAGDRSGN